MLIIGFTGCDIDHESPIVKWLKEDGLGGVLLFVMEMEDCDAHTRKAAADQRDRTGAE